MPEETWNPDEAGRLIAERDLADRRYSEALVALDRAVPRLGAVPLEAGTSPAREGVRDILREPVAGLGGHARKAARAMAALLLPGVYARHRATIRREAAVEAAIVGLGQQMDLIARFHHSLIQYAQSVAGLVDTTYRHQMIVGSGIETYEQVNAVHALRWEAMMARDRRFTAALDEIRTSIAGVQQTGITLRRELERLLAAGASASPEGSAAAPAAAAPGVRPAAVPDAVNAYRYVAFEDKYRGSEDDIHARQAGYLPLFAGASDVLDLGCGRGEFLAALNAAGVGARGLDINHEMVEACRGRGLTVDEGDALAFLENLPDGSLGGLFAAQVVEHFQPGYLTRALDAAYHKLRPGSVIVLETLNPACWSAFFDSYIRDITHAWPLHPETLKYLVTAAGYQQIEVRFLSPYTPEDKLQRLPVIRDGTATPATASLIETFNDNVDRLNGQLFSNRDYAVIGRRL